MQRVIRVLCLSFVVAVTADAILFTLFDPLELGLLGRLLGISRMAFYAISLIAFWLLAAGLSAFICFLQRPTKRRDGSPRPVESSTP